MSNGPISKDHLRACSDHGVVAPRGHEDWTGERCPVCETDAEARPGAVSDVEFTDLDMRWQIEPDTMVDLLSALATDAERQDIGPVYVAVAEITERQVRNAAGYTVQERWFNVAVAETGNSTREIIKHNSDAMDAIETIQNGEHYLEPVEPSPGALEPNAWAGVVDPYATDVEYERVDETTLHIHMEGIPSDSAYSTARREIGHIAESDGLNVRTVEAGGRLEPATVEVSTDG